MADSNAGAVNLNPVDTTIAALRALPTPSPHPLPSEYPNRIAPVEYTTYRLTSVTLTKVFLNIDGDYHLILADSGGHKFISESTGPSCDPGSVVASQIAAVRSYLDSHFHVSSTPIYPNVTVTVVGVGFYDPFTGDEHAINGAELHPILSITITP